ncbi:MAG TPA: MFS transporter [Steroidobacteraceae bacterium]|nr:MFS transporter [Steroidobacteraceae bacterium]
MATRAEGSTTHVSRPFEGVYGVSLPTAILALVPYIIVTSAYTLFRQQVAQEIGASPTGLEIINGLSTAGYAFGALLGGDLIQRFKQRTLFLSCEGLFIASCALCALAANSPVYGAGRVLQGLMTGLLLVIALPPVIQRFPAKRLPVTAAAVNIGFFGAVTVGPLLGGITSFAHAWRAFYAALGGVGCVTWLLALLTLPDAEPFNPRMRFDLAAVALGIPATVLPFWAVGELTGPGFASPLFIGPLTVGVACFVALLLVEYHRKEPLAPVKQMWHTLPLVGTLAAMIGGAAFFTLLMLAQEYLLKIEHASMLQGGLTFWPQVVGVIITATLLGVLLRTRMLPFLVLGGMLLLIGAGALLLRLQPGPGGRTTVLAAAGLLGLGAGATVSPGLYLAAFSLPSRIVGRTFALVELVRSVADFILAPVMLGVARVASGSMQPSAAGLRFSIWLTLGVTAALTLGGVALYLLGGAGLPRPDLVAWIEHNRPAIGSPPLAQKLRES